MVSAQTTSAPASQPTSTPAVSAQRIADLVAQLGDDSRAKREQATRELAGIGLAAMPALREAARTSDPEVALLAKGLLESIPAAYASTCLLWKTQLPDGLNRTFHLVGDLAVVYNNSDGKLHAYGLADGEKKWEFQTGHPGQNHAPPAMATVGTVLVTHVVDYSDNPEGLQEPQDPPIDYPVQLVALEPATGKVLWRYEAGRLFWYRLFSDGEKLFHVNKNRHVCRLSPKDGTILWTLDVPKLIGADPEDTQLRHIKIEKDVCLVSIIYGKDNGSMKWRRTVIVEADTGKILWEIKTPDPDVYYVAEDTVVNERLYVRLWKYGSKPSTIEYLPLKLYDLKSGKELPMTEQDRKEWERAKLYDIIGWGVTAAIGDRIVRDNTSTLDVYDLATGKRVWTHTLRERVDDTRIAVGYSRESWLTPPVAYENAVLTLVDDGLLALDLKTGTPLWKYPLATVITHGPVVRGDIAWFITDDGDTKPLSHERKPRYLYALDLVKAKRLGPPDDEIVEVGEK